MRDHFCDASQASLAFLSLALVASVVCFFIYLHAVIRPADVAQGSKRATIAKFLGLVVAVATFIAMVAYADAIRWFNDEKRADRFNLDDLEGAAGFAMNIVAMLIAIITTVILMVPSASKAVGIAPL